MQKSRGGGRFKIKKHLVDSCILSLINYYFLTVQESQLREFFSQGNSLKLRGFSTLHNSAAEVENWSIHNPDLNIM